MGCEADFSLLTQALISTSLSYYSSLLDSRQTLQLPPNSVDLQIYFESLGQDGLGCVISVSLVQQKPASNPLSSPEGVKTFSRCESFKLRWPWDVKRHIYKIDDTVIVKTVIKKTQLQTRDLYHKARLKRTWGFRGFSGIAKLARF